jgi:diguanylate cyclase (GGDEF)-like protein
MRHIALLPDSNNNKQSGVAIFPGKNFLARTWRSLSVLIVAIMCFAAIAEAAPDVALNNRTSTVDLWPSITTLHDPEGNVTLAEAITATDRFTPPVSSYATLGLQKKTVWLRANVTLTADSSQDWIFDIDYALLPHAHVYVLRDGKVEQNVELGRALPHASRPLLSRTQSAPLRLQPGSTYTLLLRVDTLGAMILPLTLNTPAAFHSRAMNEQMLQGALTSLALCLLLYSLMQWLSLREDLYIKYSLLIFGSSLFSMHFFGIGEQYLWTDNTWIGSHAAGISSPLASLGTALFIEASLGNDMSPRLRDAMRAVAAIIAATALAFAIDAVSLQTVTIVMATVGLSPSLLGIPGAYARIKRSDVTGWYFMAAWVVYMIVSAILIGVIKGAVDVNFWTMHAFQFGATFDMLIFMRIAVLRSAAVHLAAQRANLERDSLLSMAHSDPLTGLLNRRGLHATLIAALPNATPDHMIAVYMLDLDKFKPVNDQYGHDVGDELLIVAANRLRASMRAGDVVARLGGDEFVVMASGLKSDKQAKELGLKLLEAFRAPFSLNQHTCSVGITIGYALAPEDGSEAFALLKRADAAMYAGKAGGKNCVRRIGGTEAVAIT